MLNPRRRRSYEIAIGRNPIALILYQHGIIGDGLRNVYSRRDLNYRNANIIEDEIYNIVNVFVYQYGRNFANEIACCSICYFQLNEHGLCKNRWDKDYYIWKLAADCGYGMNRETCDSCETRGYVGKQMLEYVSTLDGPLTTIKRKRMKCIAYEQDLIVDVKNSKIYHASC